MTAGRGPGSGGTPPPREHRAVRLVVIGGSWGGLDAACELLDQLPAPLPVPVLLVLHRARSSDAEVLRAAVHRCSGQDLVEVEDQRGLTAGAVHLAPPDYHVLVEDGTLSLSLDEPVEYSRPSIDVAFGSAADSVGAGTAAVLLSGAGRDGARGLAQVGQAGGWTLVQAPATAQRQEMPAAGLASWSPDLVAAPQELGRRLAALIGAEASPDERRT